MVLFCPIPMPFFAISTNALFAHLPFHPKYCPGTTYRGINFLLAFGMTPGSEESSKTILETLQDVPCACGCSRIFGVVLYLRWNVSQRNVTQGPWKGNKPCIVSELYPQLFLTFCLEFISNWHSIEQGVELGCFVATLSLQIFLAASSALDAAQTTDLKTKWMTSTKYVLKVNPAPQTSRDIQMGLRDFHGLKVLCF